MRDCDPARGFYEEIVCLVALSLDPLTINTADVGVLDDIVVSVFSTNLLPAANVNSDSDPNNDITSAQKARLDSITRPFEDTEQDEEFRNNAPADASGNPYPGSAQIIVTGRYPSVANECDDGEVAERDPFDINGNGSLDNWEIDPMRQRILDTGNNLYDDGVEEQRGFAYTGKWVLPNGDCFGSNWNMRRMESLLNLRDSNFTAEQMALLPPSQAFVLVEVNWRHNLLLDLPVFSPLYDALGGADGAYIQVWAAFPVPSAEYDLDFLPQE
jgi:hypothetical protein